MKNLFSRLFKKQEPKPSKEPKQDSLSFKIGGGQLGVYCDIDNLTPEFCAAVFKILSEQGVKYVYETLLSHNPAVAVEFLAYYTQYRNKQPKNGPVVSPLHVLGSKQ